MSEVAPKSRRWHICLVALLTVASLVPIWTTKYFPSQNGPWYVLAGHILANYNDTGNNFAEYYEHNLYPIPHLLHTLVVSALCFVCPTLVAQKLALSLYVIGLPLSIFYFLGQASPARWRLGYFSFLMIHTYCFYRGYHNYSLSVPMFFVTLGLWLQYRDSQSKWARAVIPIAASLTYLAHLVSFVLLNMVIGWYLLVKHKKLWAAVGGALRATWIGWLMSAHFVWLNLQSNSWIDAEERVWLPFHTSVEFFFRKYFYTTSGPVAVLATIAFLWIIGLTIFALVRIVKRPAKWKSEITPWLSGTCVLTALYFVTPYKYMNWHYVNIRLIPFIVGIALTWSVIPRPALMRLFILTCASVTIVNAGLMTVEVNRMGRLVDEYTSGIAKMNPNARLLAVNIDDDVFGQIRPLTRAHEYYHVAKGGVNGQGAAQYNTLVPVRYRIYPTHKVFPRYDRDAPDDQVRDVLREYECLLLWGDDARLRSLAIETGLEEVHQEGRLTLFSRPSE